MTFERVTGAFLVALLIVALVISILMFFRSCCSPQDDYPYKIYSGLHTFECKKLDLELRLASGCREKWSLETLDTVALSPTDTWSKK